MQEDENSPTLFYLRDDIDRLELAECKVNPAK